MASLEETKKEYWKVVSRTRKSGRISDSVKAHEEQYWDAYPEDVVIAALTVHITKYPDYKENYTRGIMRNMLRQKNGGVSIGIEQQNKFNNFNQRKYDFSVLEGALVQH